MSAKDGGPAFPRTGMLHVCGPQQGMSLRDWFAGMALQGILAAPNEFEAVQKAARGKSKIERARIAYDHADAMLAARERKEDA